ncbi:MAG: bifunctional oligoribonuclease/PAP phosphatase NrnA [Bacillota bacterium]|nr:bifunctional oligoribonuclease/PAP phosphatase NrnA [Bacillota bacterium]
MNQMKDREKIIEIFKREKSFNLISHMLPDGDSIGSLLAMELGLSKLGKKVMMFTPGHVPPKYTFIKGADKVLNDKKLFDNRGSIAVVLDSSDAERLGDFSDIVMENKNIINIDHHVTNQFFGTYNLVNAEASATGEILFHLLNDLAVQIDEDIAEALYVAISTDTGSFKYENTRPGTHRVVASLMEFNINPGSLSQKVFDERPLAFYTLLKEALSSLEFYEQQRIAVMTLSLDIRKRNGATSDDLDGIVNYSRNIEGVELGILFYADSDDEVKVGFRSKKLDVSALAGRLNGGGHARAAGCRLQGNYEQVKNRVMTEARMMLKELPD